MVLKDETVTFTGCKNHVISIFVENTRPDLYIKLNIVKKRGYLFTYSGRFVN